MHADFGHDESVVVENADFRRTLAQDNLIRRAENEGVASRKQEEQQQQYYKNSDNSQV